MCSIFYAILNTRISKIRARFYFPQVTLRKPGTIKQVVVSTKICLFSKSELEVFY